MVKTLIGIVSLVFWASLTNAHACVTFSTRGFGEPMLVYNPFDPADTVSGNLRLRITRLNDAVRSVRFVLLDASPEIDGLGLGPGGPPNYLINAESDRGRPLLGPIGQGLNEGNGALAVFADRGRNTSVQNLFVIIPRGQSVSIDDATEFLQVRYQCLDANNLLLEEGIQTDGQVSIGLRLQRSIAAFAGSIGQRSGVIDFGSIDRSAATASRSIDLFVLSAGPFQIEANSESGWSLSNKPNGALIPYKATIGAAEISGGASVRCLPSPAPGGSRLSLQVTLDGPFAVLPAGNYSDVMIITFNPVDGPRTPGGCLQ